MSVATTRAAGRSCASATATQPLPVQTSAIRQRRRAIRKQLERRFDDQLGSGRGISTAGVTSNVEPPELADADDVGERLAGDAPRDERVVARREAVGLRLARVGEEALGRPAEHVLGEQPRVEVRLGRRDARPRAAAAAPSATWAWMAHETAVASLSFSDW